jgi:hypothetical protein
MKLIVRLILLAGLLALAVWSWGFFFPTPQKIIEKRLVKLARLASFTSKDGNIKRLADTERISLLLAQNIQVVVDVPGGRETMFDNREELLQAALAARPAVKELVVQFTDIGVVVNSDGKSAAALLTLKAKIGAEPDWFIEELRVTFKNTNDDWLVTRVETVKPLQ